MIVTPFELLAGISLDLLLGDPRHWPHPVRGIRWLATKLERVWRTVKIPLRLSGLLFTATLVAITAGVVWLTTPWATIIWIYYCLSIRSLDNEASEVMKRIQMDDLAGAREKLSWIVGRDTTELDESGVVRTVIETVAEKLSEGVVAPLFYLLAGGPVAMATYKAINTLDSMVGHNNERYRHFGWASARLDDLVNLIPARLTAMVVWSAAAMLWLNPRASVEMTLRDSLNHASPNAGYPEAAFAGALGIQLGPGLSAPGSGTSRTKTIGDPSNQITPATWEYARALLLVSCFLACGISVVVAAW